MFKVCEIIEFCHSIDAASKKEAVEIARNKGEIDATTKLINDWHIKKGNPIDPPNEGGINMLTDEEVDRIADTIIERVSAKELLLHSIPYSHGSPGIVVDPDVAARTGCRCYENVCFSKGIIGALSEAQREAYCPTTEQVTSPGMTRRLKNWNEAVGVCKKEIADIPKGERLEPWLSCMGRELPKRGIEI